MSIEKPLVSIICTAFNHEPFVIKSLDSILNQTYTNVEIIIVDNNSEDNTITEIDKWLENKNKIKFIKNKRNLGITKSFNQASKFANGIYLMDLSADDILLPHCIEALIKFSGINQDASILFGNAIIIDENDKHIKPYFELTLNNQIKDKSILSLNYSRILTGGICICSVSSIFRKDIFDLIGGYDEDLEYEDLDFWIRISRDHKIKYLDQILVLKRQLTNSMSQYFYKKSKIDLNKSTLKILNKAYKLNKSKEDHLALLKRVHYFIHRNFKINNFKYVLNGLILKIKIQIRALLSTSN